VTGIPTRLACARNADLYRGRRHILNVAATLPVVISDTEAVYLYGLDIIAQQQADRLYYMHDGLGSVREPSATSGAFERMSPV